MLTACAETRGSAPQSCAAPTGVVAFAATELRLGEPPLYPEETPRTASVPAFDIDRSEVTNADFARFVAQTGYVTTAERDQPGFGAPGGAVFRPPTATNTSWWHYVVKGGSYLCAPNFCRRDRAAARQPQDETFSTNHIGFRTVSRPLAD